MILMYYMIYVLSSMQLNECKNAIKWTHIIEDFIWSKDKIGDFGNRIAEMYISFI